MKENNTRWTERKTIVYELENIPLNFDDNIYPFDYSQLQIKVPWQVKYVDVGSWCYTKRMSALHEYDRLIKSIYVLEYVDNSTLRHYVQQALNRGEAYHQLKRAITSVNGNKFRGGNDYQVSQWNDCARLISNCIIYYNSALLSAFLQIQERNGRQDVVDVISRLSPVAWQHINLNGEYAFNKDRKEIDLAGLLSDVKSIS
ncbi:Tn3 family transposase [Pseudoalteromonas sp. Z9A6]|uniref:Tn3 family transposase n=1 Tax=Pseudoalteromonas sp. Z9A6 TaxID=2686352 RepID=UPI0013FE36CF|nr:Tn3 family transposase [Pseudoalteromonas sp. Z9A6]